MYNTFISCQLDLHFQRTTTIKLSSKTNVCASECSHAVTVLRRLTICLPARHQHSSSFGDMTELNNEERHTQPLKTALNSRVPQNPTSAGQAARARRGEEGQKRSRKSSTIVIISPTDCAAACQWSETTGEHWAMRTGLPCPPQTPATVPKLTLATVYNPPHTIRQDIKVRNISLFSLELRKKKQDHLLTVLPTPS